MSEPTSYIEKTIWTAYPTTIKILQGTRGGELEPKERVTLFERNRGINATIILLSALTIEGFLVDCLSSFVVGNRFSNKNTFEGRLDHHILNKISTATFGDFPELFRLTLGKPLAECITDERLLNSVRILIKFRNGLAHARSVVYSVQDFDFFNFIGQIDGFTFHEIENQYKDIHEYLSENGLVWGDGDLFQNDIADHFAALVKPYIDAVIPILPVPQSDNVKTLIELAFRIYTSSNRNEV